MREVTPTTLARIQNRIRTGETRAWQRATIQPLMLQKWSGPGFDITYDTGTRNNTYTSMVFGQPHDLRELSNIKSISINRSVASDVQSMTMELVNAINIPIGQALTPADIVQERPGWFSFDRGAGDLEGNEWRGWIVPDRIIRTYEGYGIDPTKPADKDPNMYPSGVWLIDTVTLNADGGMTIECRDLARELLEQIMFVPVVPKDYYPMRWEVRHPETADQSNNKEKRWDPQGLFKLEYEKDSNLPYIGKGLVDGDKPYVQPNGAVRGHHGREAFDGDKTSFWMSVGNQSQDSTSAFEWVQGLTPGAVHVEGVQMKVWGGPYTVYISVKQGGEWSGRKRIPYKPNFADANTDIKFVRFGKIKKGETKTFQIPARYQDGVEAIRVTLHHLYDSNIGSYPYRGGIYDVRWTPSVVQAEGGDTTKIVGNYDDYVDIVKTFLAWGGFYWPRPDDDRTFLLSTDNTKTFITYTGADDPVLAQGRVWGDFMQSGTHAIVQSYTGLDDEVRLDLGPEIWDKKPLIDGIKYIKDILAYVFFIDEYGGAIFRPPNLFELGNYMTGGDGGPHNARVTDLITLEDGDNLFSHTLKLTSLNRRDRIFVANLVSDPPIGAVVKGYDPYPSATRRISGWTDQRFSTQEEVDTMAQLIATRQAVKMRSATVDIPGDPRIQMDDQIIVKERITGTNHLFYIEGLVSNYDAITGRYTYTLTLSWLGTPDQMLTLANDQTQGFVMGSNAQSFIKAILANAYSGDGDVYQYEEGDGP